MNDTEKLLNHQKYNLELPTEIYAFGYTENLMSPGTQAIIESYQERGSHNILIIDWSSYNNGNYILEAIPNMKKIADIIGSTLLIMQNTGFNLDNFHLIGHSLGG